MVPEKSAKWVSKSAKHVHKSAKWVAKSAKHVHKSAKWVAKSAKRVHKSAKWVTKSAKRVHKSAKWVVKSMKHVHKSAYWVVNPSQGMNLGELLKRAAVAATNPASVLRIEYLTRTGSRICMPFVTNLFHTPTMAHLIEPCMAKLKHRGSMKEPGEHSTVSHHHSPSPSTFSCKDVFEVDPGPLMSEVGIRLAKLLSGLWLTTRRRS
ncbi:hypothetical protein NA56DRAFT_702479 [Hyaloscypha hepaticicola]|uniref:Uncharacterized protein n=1 Tax=Hyaloscypha hepaticicola TaxID=2082293 RepID=A0A2J6Q8V6_9HELO|nr:hypothetical protein NA56DRAFT_702479 [Hyaloscypha hepaticicola]